MNSDSALRRSQATVNLDQAAVSSHLFWRRHHLGWLPVDWRHSRAHSGSRAANERNADPGGPFARMSIRATRQTDKQIGRRAEAPCLGRDRVLRRTSASAIRYHDHYRFLFGRPKPIRRNRSSLFRLQACRSAANKRRLFQRG